MVQHRLPTPGGDTGDWGDILNDFLSQAHNTDGTLAANVVGAAQIQAGSISDSHISSSASIAKAKLASAVQTSLTAADNALAKPASSLNGKPLKWNNTSGQLEDATSLIGNVSALPALYVPSDVTGSTDMTAELETFRTANPGKMIKVAEGSTILLKNAFSTATTGDILLDFTNVTIVYDSGGSSTDCAIFCNNVANASAEVTVSGLTMATVNVDATVSQMTISAALNAQRFDWIALYSGDVNPAISGGFLGEIFQLLTAEASSTWTATRRLNRHTQYTTNIRARKLDGSRKVHIIGGTIKAHGNTEDHAITVRPRGIMIQGFVDPVVENVTFDHPWAQCLWFQACAAPKARNIRVKDVGNLANFNGYTYGVYFYGMNDAGDARDLVVRNGRHAGCTTDGNSGNSSTWYNLGIPTNLLVTNVHGINCHASVIDTHEEGDNIIFDTVVNMYPYQDEDIAGGFTGLGVQLRCARPTIRNYTQVGGTRGIRVNPVEHGFEDTVTLENIVISDLTEITQGSNNDIGILLDDMSALTHVRHTYLDGILHGVGINVQAGKKSKLTIKNLILHGYYDGIDVQAGAEVVAVGTVTFDGSYSQGKAVRSAGTTTYHAVFCRSDSPNGGCTIVFMQPVNIIKTGGVANPVSLFEEKDTTATKKIYAAGIKEYAPTGTTATTLFPTSYTTLTAANVTSTNWSAP